MATTRKVIGSAAVDSGTLILVDPCYLKDWRDGDYRPGPRPAPDGNSYDAACRTTHNADQGGELLVAGERGTAVAFSTGWGDGCYPVEAEYERGRVKSVTIRFFGDEDDGE